MPAPNEGEEVVMEHHFNQWTLRIFADGSYEFVNLGPDSARRYYRVVPGKYGEPLIDQEPDLAIPVPLNLLYRRLNNGQIIVPMPEDKIIGVICRNGPRFSLTTAKDKGVGVRMNPDDSIQVGDKPWWIALLLCPDGQRFTPNRWVAYLAPEKPFNILVAEMADVLRDWDRLMSLAKERAKASPTATQPKIPPKILKEAAESLAIFSRSMARLYAEFLTLLTQHPGRKGEYVALLDEPETSDSGYLLEFAATQEDLYQLLVKKYGAEKARCFFITLFSQPRPRI